MRHLFRPLNLLFAALLILASCDSVDKGMLEPAMQPQMDHLEGDTIVAGDDGKTYTLVTTDGKFPRMSASKWINRKGGYVFLEGVARDGRPVMHVLYIPEEAVTKNTLFTMTVTSPHFIKVDLRAQIERKVKGDTELVDVGHLGFKRQVLVALDHTIATNVDNTSRLTLLYDPEGGRPYQRKGGAIYAGYENYLIAALDHFSKYAVALD